MPPNLTVKIGGTDKYRRITVFATCQFGFFFCVCDNFPEVYTTFSLFQMFTIILTQPPKCKSLHMLQLFHV